jgi:hypothetical protein
VALAAPPGAPFPTFTGEIPRVLPKAHRHTASYYVLSRSTWQNSQGSLIPRNCQDSSPHTWTWKTDDQFVVNGPLHYAVAEAGPGRHRSRFVTRGEAREVSGPRAEAVVGDIVHRLPCCLPVTPDVRYGREGLDVCRI